MAFFTDVDVQSLINAESIHIAKLLEMRFKSTTIRVSDATVNFTDLNDDEWSGIGDLGTSSGVVRNRNLSAQKKTYGLGPIPIDIANGAFAEREEYANQPAIEYLQFFSNGLPIKPPFAIDYSLMDSVDRTLTGDGLARLTLTCEGLMARRGAPVFGYHTDADQRKRSPLDKSHRFVVIMKDLKIPWPNF